MFPYPIIFFQEVFFEISERRISKQKIILYGKYWLEKEDEKNESTITWPTPGLRSQ